MQIMIALISNNHEAIYLFNKCPENAVSIDQTNTLALVYCSELQLREMLFYSVLIAAFYLESFTKSC